MLQKIIVSFILIFNSFFAQNELDIISNFIHSELLPNGQVSFSIEGNYKFELDKIIRNDSLVKKYNTFSKNIEHVFESNDTTKIIVADISYSVKNLWWLLKNDRINYLWEQILAKNITEDKLSIDYEKVIDEQIKTPKRFVLSYSIHKKIKDGYLRIVLKSSSLIKRSEHALFDINLLVENDSLELKYDELKVDTNYTVLANNIVKDYSITKFSLRKNENGFLIISRDKPICDECDAFTIRIIDNNFNLVWMQKDELTCYYRPIIFDFQNDGIDEIIFYIADHGKSIIKVFAQTVTD